MSTQKRHTLENELREAFPHGHERYIPMTLGELRLHSEKNHDYAAGGDPLGNFRRVAAILEQYPGLSLADPAIVAAVYAMKQIDAYLWMKSNKHAPMVEGVACRLLDIAVYAKIAALIEEEGAVIHAFEGRGS